jgi:type VI secretion system protein ImpF
MADLFPKERLQPSLLDRLSDDEPYKKVESRDQRVLSFQRLKRSVVRDIEWLLNAGCLESTLDLHDYPQVRRSVLNYGVPDLTGTTASNVDAATLERMLRKRILNFEPRLLPMSLRVRVTNKDEHNTILIEIEGELWSQPLPERLYLKTILDLELGNFEVKPGVA